MYICSCHAVTDGRIKECVNEGVRTPRQLARKTKCGTNCGICWKDATALFKQLKAAKDAADAAAKKPVDTAADNSIDVPADSDPTGQTS